MSIRIRTLLVIGTILISSLVIFYFVVQNVFMNSFASLEVEDVQRNLDRVVNVIDYDLNALALTVEDWAFWDDTYAYALGDNEEYAEANLYDAVFLSFGINVAVFLDGDLNVLFGRGYDTETQEAVPVPASLWTHIQPDDWLVNGLNVPADDSDPLVTRGIVLLREGPLMVASAPIRYSDGSGPSAGVLIWGKYLNEIAGEHLSTLVGFPLEIYTADAFNAPDDVVMAARQLSPASPRTVQALDDWRIAGYTLVDDIYGSPAAIVRVELPRSIFRSGTATLSYSVVSLLVGGVLLVVGILLLLEKLVLARLARLSSGVDHIADSGSLDERVEVSGNDELTTLGNYINKMLAALQRSQLELQQAKESLEKQVSLRTAQLSASNQDLREEIKQHEKTQAELMLARDQALESLRFKTQILANVSHDARTPLNAISGYVEMLQDEVYGSLNDDQRKALQRILGNTQDLLIFINNLLDSARLEARSIQPEYRTFRVRDMLAAVEGSTQLRAKEKQLDLTFVVEDDVPEQICSDEQRIKQIITNLTVNAIKFTERGQIWVRAFAPDATHLGIAVKDSGKGIEPQMQERIFEAFWQVDGSVTRQNNSGVGLGLAIVSALVALLNGRITLESELGQGSEFTVLLPVVLEQSERIG